MSPLTWRILTVNLLAPIILVAGLFYLAQYERALLSAELHTLHVTAELIAATIAEGAMVINNVPWDPVENEAAGVAQAETMDVLTDIKVITSPAHILPSPTAPSASDEGTEGGSPTHQTTLVPFFAYRFNTDQTRQMVSRLADLAGVRVQLFNHYGSLVTDNRTLIGSGGAVQVIDLPSSLIHETTLATGLWTIYDRLLHGEPDDSDLSVYNKQLNQQTSDYREVQSALNGEIATAIRNDKDRVHLSVAIPVQYYKKIVGALMVSCATEATDENLFQVRLTIIQLFLGTAAVTILLSLYLAGTIVQPLARLVRATEQGRKDRTTIPLFHDRRDEIGDLATVLRAMTEALWSRMDAIERFAADVTHEIRNPLSSLRSAVETVVRLDDPIRQKKLMAIIQDDVQRLDRLITDISDASRLDAELSQVKMTPVALRSLLEALVQVYRATSGAVVPEGKNITFLLSLPGMEGNVGDPSDTLTVLGSESRLVQVIRNLLANAVSFSLPGGTIILSARRCNSWIEVIVEDEGPGIPSGKEATIFERFYSERPSDEKFGIHSGLGLSISRQIVEAHGGLIFAGNCSEMQDNGVRIHGARFTLCLPTGS